MLRSDRGEESKGKISSSAPGPQIGSAKSKGFYENNQCTQNDKALSR